MAEKVLVLQGVALPDGQILDLVVRAGETRRLAGPRARLERITAFASGLRAPEVGRAQLLGRPFSSMREEDRRVIRAASIGVASSTWPLLPWLTVEENVRLASEHGAPDDVDEALRAFDLTGLRSSFVTGPTMAVTREGALLARAVAKKPRLLVWQADPQLREADVLSLLRRVRGLAGSRPAVLILLDENRVPADGEMPADLASPDATPPDDQLIEVPTNLRAR